MVALLVLFAGAVFGDSQYIRLRYVEGQVTIHGSDGQQQATINTPVLQGDEIETSDGRGELAFRSGLVIRLGDYTAVRVESDQSPVSLTLLQGTVFVDSHIVNSFRDELEVRAGDAQVYMIDEGNVRIDLGSEGTARITSLTGEVEVRASGRRVLLSQGEKTYVDPGQDPERPERYEGRYDELDDWNQSRMDSYARNDYGRDQYVDDDIYYDSYELGDYGDWRQYENYGYVWVPNVSYGWRPYYDGRWSYCNSSWFWISYEPWGWAPYHYGRWGFSGAFGWYWIPGNSFAPAWVSWYDYGDYIGWCPLNYYNRPVYVYNNHNSPYPPVQKQKTLDAGGSWNFVKKKELTNFHLVKALAKPEEVKRIRIDDRKVLRSPDKQLINYAIPKTGLVQGYENDKRVIKPPQDIKNPVGINHRDEQFGHGSGSQKGSPPRDTKGHKQVEKPKVENPKVQNPKVEKPKVETPKGREEQFGYSWDSGRTPSKRESSSSDRGKYSSADRDQQFYRGNSDKERQSRSYVSPYYRDKDKNNGRDDQRGDQDDWKPYPWTSPRSSDRDGIDRDNSGEISPRYREEAKKYFERFDENKNHSDSRSRQETSSPDRSQRPDPPQERYQRPDPPKREYHAPPQSKQNDNRNHSSSSQKPPKHKD